MSASTLAPPKPPRKTRIRWFAQANPATPFCLLALGVMVALGASEAGFYPVHTATRTGLGWYPAGVILIVLVAATAATIRPRAVPRTVLAAAGLMVAFAAWSLLSITWADAGGVAWDAGNRALIYAAVFCLFALWPISVRGAQVLLAGLAFGIAGLALVQLVKINGAPDPLVYFTDARLIEPAGYVNANVALWMLGLWPALYLSATRSVPVPVRALALGAAGVCAAMPILTQSRGWAIALPLALVVWIALTPERGRALAALGVVAVGTAAIAQPLLDVHDRFSRPALDGLMATATSRIVVLAIVLTAIGAVAAVADRRLSVGAARARLIDRGVLALAVGAVAIAIAGAALTTTDPVGRLSDSWQSFKEGGEGGRAGASRFTSVDTNRYDFWRVSWELFGEHPFRGIGGGNFQQDYIERGASGEQPRYPHSLQLGVLSQTGIVGALLLFGAMAAALVAAARRRGVGAEVGAAVAAAVAVFAYWLIHASIDWFWEFPGVTAPAVAMLGLACAVGRRRASAAEKPPAPAGRLGANRAVLGYAAAAIAAAAVLTSLALPWFSERMTAAALADTSRPSDSLDTLRRASSLNPLTPIPHLAAGGIAIRSEDTARAEREFRRAIEIEPRTSFAYAELSALASERGERARALRLAREAVRHAPRSEPALALLRAVERGERFGVQTLNEMYLAVGAARMANP